jgi:hypothetical protein
VEVGLVIKAVANRQGRPLLADFVEKLLVEAERYH